MLAAVRPDVVVLDLMMPKFNGWDVLRFIRSNPALKDVPVIHPFQRPHDLPGAGSGGHRRGKIPAEIKLHARSLD